MTNSSTWKNKQKIEVVFFAYVSCWIQYKIPIEYAITDVFNNNFILDFRVILI